MTNRKGELSLVTLLTLISAFLIVAIIGAGILTGALGDFIEQGAEEVRKSSDYTIEVDSKEKLSDLSMFVYHRASNDGCRPEDESTGQCQTGSASPGGVKPTVCFQNKGKNTEPLGTTEEGYPALEGTYLGAKPTCAGMASTPLRGYSQSGGNVPGGRQSGYDMEGVYSREYFEITSDQPLEFTSDPSSSSGSTWLENNLLAPSKKSFEESITQNCANGYGGSGSKFAVYFSAEVDDNRGGSWMFDRLGTAGNSEHPYCNANPNKLSTLTNIFDSAGGGSGFSTDLKLCPGDKGFIQMNKGLPTNTGEADEDTGANSAKFGYIHITDVENPDCGTRDYSPNLESATLSIDDATGRLEITTTVNNRRSAEMSYRVNVIDESNGNTLYQTDSFNVNGGANLEVSEVTDKIESDLGGCQIEVQLEEKLLTGGSWSQEDSLTGLPVYTSACTGSAPLYAGYVVSNDIVMTSENPPLDFGGKLIRSKIPVVNDGSEPTKFKVAVWYNDERRAQKSKSFAPGTSVFTLNRPYCDALGGNPGNLDFELAYQRGGSDWYYFSNTTKTFAGC